MEFSCLRFLNWWQYKHAIEKIRKGKSGTLPAYEIYDMVPFMEHPKNDKELAAIEWGVGCLACRTMMGIGIDGTIYPAGYPTTLTLGNALKDNFKNVLNSQLYKDIRDRKSDSIGKALSLFRNVVIVVLLTSELVLE